MIALAICELDDLIIWEYSDENQLRGDDIYEPVPDIDDDFRTTGATINVTRDLETLAPIFWYTRGKNTGGWETQIVQFLNELQDHVADYGVTTLMVRTEHHRNGNIFRGHPNYRNTGRWNDWAIFDWGPGYGELPGEIWCFVDFSDAMPPFSTTFADCPLHRGVYAVVESACYCPNRKFPDDPTSQARINESELFIPIIKETKNNQDSKFYLADVGAIVDTTCVFPDIGSDDKCRYFQVLPRNKWANQFEKWLEAPHSVDEEAMGED